jgi:hypothetical protein
MDIVDDPHVVLLACRYNSEIDRTRMKRMHLATA